MMRSRSNGLAFLWLLLTTYGLLAAPDDVRQPVSGGLYSEHLDHVWNRLHRELFVITGEDGTEYGFDSSIPPNRGEDTLVTSPSFERSIALLDEFLEPKPESPIVDPVKRAVLQYDLWTLCDSFASPWPSPEIRHREQALLERLAACIQRLALTKDEIARLPDNYSQAVNAGEFAREYDADEPAKPFLPPDLFDPEGRWVQIDPPSAERVTGPMHVEAVSGRSGFEVFISLPGGRKETLEYLEKLNFFPTPWRLEPAPIGTMHPSGEKVRMDVLRINPDTPQFPVGTMVALVRRMVLISNDAELIVSPLVQGVQLRVYRKIPEHVLHAGEAKDTQAFHEFVLRRKKLFSGESGGLHAVREDEREPQLLFATHDPSEQERLAGPVALTTCVACHSPPGIFSVNSYSRFVGRQLTDPELRPSQDPASSRQAVVEWKREQFNWGFLKALLLETKKGES